MLTRQEGGGPSPRIWASTSPRRRPPRAPPPQLRHLLRSLCPLPSASSSPPCCSGGQPLGRGDEQRVQRQRHAVEQLQPLVDPAHAAAATARQHEPVADQQDGRAVEDHLVEFGVSTQRLEARVLVGFGLLALGVGERLASGQIDQAPVQVAAPVLANWPSKSLTPRRFDWESRPSDVEPPAFLCAICYYSSVINP